LHWNVDKIHGVPVPDDGGAVETVIVILNQGFRLIRILLIPGVITFILVIDNEVSEAALKFFNFIEVIFGILGIQGEILRIFVNFTILIILFIGSISAINGIYSVFLFINIALMKTNSTQLWLIKLW